MHENVKHNCAGSGPNITATVIGGVLAASILAASTLGDFRLGEPKLPLASYETEGSPTASAGGLRW